jgi:hypothetical protein
VGAWSPPARVLQGENKTAGVGTVSLSAAPPINELVFQPVSTARLGLNQLRGTRRVGTVPAGDDGRRENVGYAFAITTKASGATMLHPRRAVA